MTTNFIIYESAMCCSSGVCGPNPDQSLIQLQDTIEKMKALGARFERYGITQNPKKFRENPDVLKLIQEKQIKALPITTVNGKVMKVGSYPVLNELQKCLQDSDIDSNVQTVGKPGAEACCTGDGPIDENGCCSGQNSCDIRCGPNHIGSIKPGNRGKCC
jgi:hypothetical protein